MHLPGIIPRTGRFIAAHVAGARLRLVLYLLVGLAAGTGALIGLIGLGRIVEAGTTTSFDDWVLELIAGLRTADLTNLMLDTSALGSDRVLGPLLIGASAVLLLARRANSVLLLWVAVAGGHLLNLILKLLYHRPRPPVDLRVTAVSSMSFPSGHAMAALIAYVTMAVLLGRLLESTRVRFALWSLAFLISIAVGVSHMYLGVHYPSDVLAGYAAGAAWVAFVAAAPPAIRLFSSGDSSSAPDGGSRKPRERPGPFQG